MVETSATANHRHRQLLDIIESFDLIQIYACKWIFYYSMTYSQPKIAESQLAKATSHKPWKKHSAHRKWLAPQEMGVLRTHQRRNIAAASPAAITAAITARHLKQISSQPYAADWAVNTPTQTYNSQHSFLYDVIITHYPFHVGRNPCKLHCQFPSTSPELEPSVSYQCCYTPSLQHTITTKYLETHHALTISIPAFTQSLDH